MTTAELTTAWKFDFGQRVRSQSGDEGEVIARTEKINLEGGRHRAYRIEAVDPKWGDRASVWAPETRLRAV